MRDLNWDVRCGRKNLSKEDLRLFAPIVFKLRNVCNDGQPESIGDRKEAPKRLHMFWVLQRHLRIAKVQLDSDHPGQSSATLNLLNGVLFERIDAAEPNE